MERAGKENFWTCPHSQAETVFWETCGFRRGSELPPAGGAQDIAEKSLPAPALAGGFSSRQQHPGAGLALARSSGLPGAFALLSCRGWSALASLNGCRWA